MKRTLALALGCVVVLSACGLPLRDGVGTPARAPAAAQQRGDIQVLPPGPRDDASPREVVRDFFGAQSNPTDEHAIAREYLAPALRRTWRDGPQVTVFDRALTVEAVAGASDTYLVTGRRLGRIAPDGSYSGDSGPLSVRVHLTQTESGRWVIDEVPNGLLLSAADRDRSFIPQNVYFLGPAAAASGEGRHLVADRVFVPVTSDPADALVRRLLAGPSQALAGSVETAIPARTTLLRPVRTDAGGLVTVELSEQVADAPRAQREQLSAQLVWTLRGVGSEFSRLRLTGGGRAVQVSVGADDLQNRGDWGSYDPDGLSPRSPALYIANRRLRSLDGALVDSPVSDDRGSQPVDLAASAVNDGRLAVLTLAGREWQLRTGPPGGPFGAPIWRGRQLASPSWGRGQRGLWFLDAGRLMLAPLGGRPMGIPVDAPDLPGPYTVVRVSRDGARVALVTGRGRERRLVVGRVYTVRGVLRVGGLRPIAPTVQDVGHVSWDGSTSLVVLGRVPGLTAAVPVRVAVDGSVVAPLVRVGLETTEPQRLAAAPGRPLVVGATVRGVPTLFRDNSRQYSPEAVGAEPFYPG